MKITASIILALTIAIGNLPAQYAGVAVSHASVEKRGDTIRVSFDMAPGKLHKDYSVTITPVIYNGEGEWKTIEPVRLVGSRRNIYDQRTGNISGDRRLVGRNTTVEKYSAGVPFEEWMQYISVAVEQVVEGCCTRFEFPVAEIVGEQLLYYDITPRFDVTPIKYELTELEKYDLDNPFLHPMEDHGKRYDILFRDRDKGSSQVVFTVGSHTLDMDFQGNKDVLDAIGKAFELIENEPNARLKQVMIAGYASPEGTLTYNTALAQRRAESVKEYIRGLMSDPRDDLFELYNGREDWGGLREMVEKSEMPERQEILRIIDSYTMEQEVRKTELKKLGGGAPYRYMLENFYPSLRSAGYVQVYYEIDRRATVAAAVTDEHGRTTWIDPDSPANRIVTAMNRSLEHMVGNRFDEALSLLTEFDEDPRTWNHIGVCYMMTGDYDLADKYFNLAVQNGDMNALINLEQTEWSRKVKLTD